MGPRKCQVCDGSQSKYKCPACLIPYCSLICFKKHKEIPCVRPESASEAKAAPGAALHVERPYYVDEQSEVLQNLQLEATASCSEIRNALEDEELQKLIYNIDTSPDAENMLSDAKSTFTDKRFQENSA
ncbi:unnamed protein product [Ilex paraguariensis]|uniref:HIT-type domain-containing protein n=1 Tax=Ilex paraguariensis TaxID=185542 RepID=A0ABC8RB88_9AQUA